MSDEVRTFDIDGKEAQWIRAVSAWMQRDSTPLAAMVAKCLDIPDDARALLCDLVTGTATRGKGGRPKERGVGHEVLILAEALAKWAEIDALPRKDRKKGQIPKIEACAFVGDRRGIGGDAVRGILDRNPAWTLEWWNERGRHIDWKKLNT